MSLRRKNFSDAPLPRNLEFASKLNEYAQIARKSFSKNILGRSEEDLRLDRELATLSNDTYQLREEVKTTTEKKYRAKIAKPPLDKSTRNAIESKDYNSEAYKSWAICNYEAIIQACKK